MSTLVYSIFSEDKSAGTAVEQLIEDDFTRDELCVLLRDERRETRVSELSVEVKPRVAEGVVVSTALGAVGGALVATSGGLLVAGPLVALLQGIVGGSALGVFGGFVGGLGGMHVGIDKPHGGLAEALLVGVVTHRQRRIAAARGALERAGAIEVRVKSRIEAIRELRNSDPYPDLAGPYGMA